MNRNKHRKKLDCNGKVFSLVRCVILVQFAINARLAYVAGQEAFPQYQGPKACVDCHLTPNPLRQRDFVMLNEANRWLHEDKHGQAFQVLEGELGKQIGTRLGIDVTSASECLNCHVGLTNADRPNETSASTAHARHGVSCEACHGPSSLWDLPHRDSNWRRESPQSKSALGMIAIRSPVVRAETCYSCHVGDISQGKFVTHDMYAAGHPPLPNVELATFSQAMPTHWRYLVEKGNFQHRQEFLTQNPHVGTTMPRTRNLAVGSLVAFQAAVRLLAERSRNGGSALVDLAVFDCGSCHHDLRSDQSRQAKYLAGGRRPGRVPMMEWPSALIDLAVWFSATSDTDFQTRRDELAGDLEMLQLALDARPFGDRKRIVETANRLTAELDQLVATVNSRSIDQARARSFLSFMANDLKNRISKEGRESTGSRGRLRALDFHSARQLAWATRAMAIELATDYPVSLAKPESVDKRSAPDGSTVNWRDIGESNVRIYRQWIADSHASSVNRIDGMLETLGVGQRVFLELPQLGYDPTRFQRRYLSSIRQFEPTDFVDSLLAFLEAIDQ